jgi:7,8-dihydropterin-6-yl-methyl-4-(beta-D-ribofuranosyl)aminobenzene 5'-phosphate synthase
VTGDVFGETSDVEIVVLVDNRADLLVRSSQGVKRYTHAPLLAEHGFAALVNLKAAGVGILWDAGISERGLIENMARMKIAPSMISKIALSHGHGDHTAALTNVLKAMDLRAALRKWPAGAPVAEMRRWAEGRSVPLVVHPAAFRERWRKQKDGRMVGPVLPAPRMEWEAAGAEVVLSEGPYRLAAGCWTSGIVPRRSFETTGISAQAFYREGNSFLPDRVEEDQAVVINVAGKGLVVLSGCAHSGIVNTVSHAQEISGVERVWAIIGGFHLARANAADIQRTVDEIKRLRPHLVAPTHCTGFQAMAAFAAQMPDAFAQGVVGTTYVF